MQGAIYFRIFATAGGATLAAASISFEVRSDSSWAFSFSALLYPVGF
jgi:hypothetical protein